MEADVVGQYVGASQLQPRHGLNFEKSGNLEASKL